jgi:hypothetical protein
MPDPDAKGIVGSNIHLRSETITVISKHQLAQPSSIDGWMNILGLMKMSPD